MSGLRQFASDTLPDKYRPCAGIFLLNRCGQVFAGRRNDVDTDEVIGRLIDKPWQLPQGGIDPGETPGVAVMRELQEEVGTGNATVLAQSRQWHCYDLPREIAQMKWSGKYRGQAQKWFALRFDGADSEINIATAHPEFDAWQWVNIEDVCALAVAFKRDVYARIVDEFRPYSERLRQAARP
ncbi:MAG: RNA pyrophosphohydrolase [Alphaproteobacteria bacterium]